MYADHFSSGQHSWHEMAKWLETYARNWTTELEIVVESFVITQATLKKSRQMEPIEFIGVARYLTQTYTKRELVLQSPSEAKAFSTDEKLKHIGWWNAGNVHANDASRHLLLYLLKTGRFEINRLRDLPQP